MAEINSLTINPVALFHCDYKDPLEVPRQATLLDQVTGKIELLPHISESVFQDLLGIERIWVIYQFHKNQNWKPLVDPPRGGGVKRGVFATRSPYRPNSLGLSCLKVKKIEGRSVWVEGFDLLDQTPIFDIKPYLSYADCFPDSAAGWVDDLPMDYQVLWSEKAQEKIQWLEQQLQTSVSKIVENQLQIDPTNGQKKRVKSCEGKYVFSYKTWRLMFFLIGKNVRIEDVSSGYTGDELSDSLDPYCDKEIHKKFLCQFKNN